MGDVLLLFNISRPRRLIELSNVTQTASRTLAENSRMMIHPGLAALNGHWDKDEYAAGYRARLTAIPDFDGAHHCWYVGWEDADTEMLELVRHRKALAEGREDDYPETWGLLFDAGGDARVNGIPFDDERTAPWKEGWVETDINLGVHGVEAQ